VGSIPTRATLKTYHLRAYRIMFGVPRISKRWRSWRRDGAPKAAIIKRHWPRYSDRWAWFRENS
jgi:hypothetical protein